MMPEANEPALVIARGMTPDGYIALRYLSPDGNVFTGALTVEMAAALAVTPPVKVWHTDNRYGFMMRTAREYQNSERTRNNLLYFSDGHPLLFEEMLQFLESADPMAAKIVTLMLEEVNVAQPKSGKSLSPAERLRQVMASAPLLAKLEMEEVSEWRTTSAKLPYMDMTSLARHANKLLKRAVLCLGDYGHPLLPAACVAAWIMRKSPDWRLGILRPEAIDDFEFIAENLDAVIAVQEELSQRPTIDRETVAAILSHASPLRVGVL
jgi:hypothetical protein